MGVCDSFQKGNNKYEESPNIFHQQLKNIPNNYAYKFDYSYLKNNFNNKTFNLKFIFCNFKVKYCISHKIDRNSVYITEIKIGSSSFPLVINSGQSPNIPNLPDINQGYYLQKDFTFDELENTYFSIDIYEYTEDMSSLNMSMSSIPQELKSKANCYSYFSINLSSFLFKSSNCDFPLMGTNQLSTKTRIVFNCIIEHREQIRIDAAPLVNGNIQRLVFEYKDISLVCQTRQTNNYFAIMTPPLTMEELQNANIFLETAENDDYTYISLNGLKARIIVDLSTDILNAGDFSEIELHNPINKNDTNNTNGYFGSNTGYPSSPLEYTFSSRNNPMTDTHQYNNIVIKNSFTEQNKEAALIISNLPYLTQINALYFTEYGDIYNTSILHLINDDPELHNFRKSKQISSDDIYNKLCIYYGELSKEQYDFNITNELQILLLRSIDTDKFMFVYPTKESLFQMMILMMNLGIISIKKILTANEEYRKISFSKIINLIMKREELDNAVLYYLFKNYPNRDNSPIILYNQLYLHLFYLYQYMISNKISSSNDSSLSDLSELYSRLYFKKSYLRQLMLMTIYGRDYFPNDKARNIFIYDEINDYKINSYLTKDTISYIKKYSETPEYYQTVQFDKYKLFKRIILTLRECNLWKYPLDYFFFYDNSYILNAIEADINDQKKENLNKSFSNDFYETLMLFSNSYYAITNINNALIGATNGHNQYAVYALFIYFKSLFEYYYKLAKIKLIFDYNLFERAAERLIEAEDSVSLPRLFWFYYCSSHLTLTGNLKWFIINIVNKNFDKLAFHWSFTIRQVYFKLIIFIFYDKLKSKEGQFFNRKKLEPFFNKSLNTNNKNEPYKFQANKDFDSIRKEYGVWEESKRHNPKAELPPFTLPAPVVNVID